DMFACNAPANITPHATTNPFSHPRASIPLSFLSYIVIHLRPCKYALPIPLDSLSIKPLPLIPALKLSKPTFSTTAMSRILGKNLLLRHGNYDFY
ncbi:hypothetical protein, partial [Nitrosomonas sp. Nm132]|uniref:hypothetical protein n=1 Tax=Nitrosomonas sp. Nm132 TaxID=1881053 RepID=UPI001C40B68B